MVDIHRPTQVINGQTIVFINHNLLLICATHRKVRYILLASNVGPRAQCYTTKNTVWRARRKNKKILSFCSLVALHLDTFITLIDLQKNFAVILHYGFITYRVLNGCSPRWVKLNLPATGHRTGTGFLAKIRYYCFSLNCGRQHK